MKTWKLTLISVALLAALVIGAVAIQVQAKKPLKLKVKWSPASYVLDNSPPTTWNAELYFAPPRPLDEIDTATLMLEGMYPPASAPYMSENKPRLVVPFNGYDVLDVLLLKAGHMAPGE